MSEKENPEIGRIAWTDLTVAEAETIRDFYREVVGWKAEPVDMGDYSDFNMIAPGDDGPMVGVCHARGSNRNLPSQWLIYVVVADVDASIEACRKRGGDVVDGPRPLGEGRFCVIRDPAGAVCALYQTG